MDEAVEEENQVRQARPASDVIAKKITGLLRHWSKRMESKTVGAHVHAVGFARAS